MMQSIHINTQLRSFFMILFGLCPDLRFKFGHMISCYYICKKYHLQFQ